MAGKSKNDKTIVLDIQVRYGEAIGKITECKKQIDELNKSNNELKKQLKEGEISQKEFTKAVDANKASISLYNKEIKTLKDEIRNNVATQLLFENNLKSLRGQIENTDNALKSLNNSLQESAKRRELEQTLQSLRTEFSNTQSASLSFQANIGDYNNISAEALEALKNIDSNLSTLIETMQRSETSTSALEASLVKLTSSLAASMAKSAAAGGVYGALAAVILQSVIFAYKKWQEHQEEVIRINGIVSNSIRDVNLSSKRNVQEELTRLELLYNATQKTNKPQSERIRAAKELQRLYPGYFGNLTQEEILAGKAATSYVNLADSILKAAKARASQDKIVENEKKILDLQDKIAREEEKMEKAKAKIKEISSFSVAKYLLPPQITQLKTIIESEKLMKAGAAVANYKEEIEKLNDSNKILVGNISTDDLIDKQAEVANAAAQEAQEASKAEEERRRKEEAFRKASEDKMKSAEAESKAITELAKAQAQEQKDIAANEQAGYKERLEALNAYQVAQRSIIELDKQDQLATLRSKYKTQAEYETQAANQIKLINLNASKQLEALNKEQCEAQLRGENTLAIQIEAKKAEIESLSQLDGESNAEFLNRELTLKVQQADLEQQQLDYQTKMRVDSLQAVSAVAGGISEVFSELGGKNEAMAVFAKSMALFQIGLDTATALTSGIAAAQTAKPFPANLVAIATTVAAVLSNIAKAKKYLTSEKQPKAPKMAIGGLVSGPGSGTSDNIPVHLSNGESVLTARATSMFSPVLSAFNQIGGGVPISLQDTSSQVMGEEMLSRAFSKAILSMPNPVVSVEEIDSVASRVNVLESSRSL